MGSAVTKRPFGVRWSSETRHLSRSLSQSRIAAAGRALGDEGRLSVLAFVDERMGRWP
jgi:hypothetical protein